MQANQRRSNAASPCPVDVHHLPDAAPIPARKQVLLIVDDEPDILSSLEALLAYSLPDVKVLTASSGAKGMVIARSNVLDMVLSDFRMTKMDGVEFLRRARIVQADIPMVIMSADAGSEFAQKAFDVAGLKLVVAKPFDLENLVGLVRSFLDHGPAVAVPKRVPPSFDEDGSDRLSVAWTPDRP
jgi:DNA-binding NtrC family response regulator